MKNPISWSVILILMTSSLRSHCQNTSDINLEVGTHKMTLLLLMYGNEPALITDVRVGLKRNLVYDYKENKVFIQASHTDGFIETNMMIELSSGDVKMFNLKFTPKPSVYLHKIDLGEKPKLATTKVDDTAKNNAGKATVTSNPDPVKTNTKFVEIVNKMNKEKTLIHDVGENNYNITLQLKGIYEWQGHYLFSLRVVNSSASTMDIGLMELYTKAKKLKKKTTVENVFNFKVVYFDVNQFPSGMTLDFCVVTEKTAIDKSKNLELAIWEKYPGQRSFKIKIDNAYLYNLKLIK